MRILYYDCFAGISGDMNLAALVDLGVDEGHLRAELEKLGIGQEFTLSLSHDARRGIVGTRADVELANEDHRHGHRNLSDIETIFAACALTPEVRRTALDIFRTIAAAEARVHGKAIDEVHFHEVGATDSIVDVVAAAVAYHALDVDEVWCSPVELGGGFVRCAHGTLPVPAPATAEILTGVPTTRGATDREMTTPTGAAIVKTLARRFEAAPRMTVTHTGYGIGHRDTEIPNVLRVHLSEISVEHERSQEDACLLECNIDDMTGEALGVALDTLMAEGASDVHFTPIIMKKTRPATRVSVLCPVGQRERFEQLLFRHTTTLGVKAIPVDKVMLDKRVVSVDTPLGPVRVKQALSRGQVVRAKPELEDCRALAEQHDLPLLEVYRRIGPAVSAPDDQERL